MSNSVGNTSNDNNTHCTTVFKQTFKFSKHVPEQKISPEGFLIRDCGCVMRFLPNLDKLNKTKSQPTAITKNQNVKNSSHIHSRNNLNRTKMFTTEMHNGKDIENTMILENFNKRPYNIQHTSLYQSTYWMEPRVVPIKYTTEVNFDLGSPLKKFTETIDVQMKLVPCPYIQQIGTTTRYKTSIETQIQSEYTLPLDV